MTQRFSISDAAAHGSPGRLVLVVGPSGAGKDTLIAAARTALAGDARYVFPRRVVTRPAVAEVEDHESVGPEAFAAEEAGGAYALSWRAHGLCYGLPRTVVDDLAAGRIVVANGSRAVADVATATFPGTRIVLIEARPQVRAERLARRGRETAAQIAGRLAREVEAGLAGAVRVDNSGSIEAGVAGFVAALRRIAGE